MFALLLLILSCKIQESEENIKQKRDQITNFHQLKVGDTFNIDDFNYLGLTTSFVDNWTTTWKGWIYDSPDSYTANWWYITVTSKDSVLQMLRSKKR